MTDVHEAERTIKRTNRILIRLGITALALVFVVTISTAVFVAAEAAADHRILTCQTRGFDQVLDEVLHHVSVRPPPRC